MSLLALGRLCIIRYFSLFEGSREAVVREMLPLKTHQITVIAVYRDGVEKKGSAEFTHSGMFPEILCVLVCNVVVYVYVLTFCASLLCRSQLPT